ncbi:MAG: radical SAM protein [Oligoflexia bacterium]|nr:radical SAM protein [Oligoflexia bacterium]
MSILDRMRNRSAELLVPFQATIELTTECNARCGHCYLASHDDRVAGGIPLSVDEWKRVFDELAAAGTLVLIFMGGEALLHPRFWQLAEYAATKNFALSLISNGLAIDETAAERLAGLGFYQVSLSLYSMEAEIHDRMTRRKGSLQRAMAAVERLRARGIPVSVNCLLTSANIERCFELEDWAGARGASVQFDPMVTPRSDSALDPTLLRATPEQLRGYYREARRRGRAIAPAPVAMGDPVCNAGRGKCAVSVTGELLACLDVRESLGNLREASFEELWNSPRAERLRGLRNEDLRFDPSGGDGAFCDHCPGMAASEVGDPRAAVPFLMELARIRREVAIGDCIFAQER